MEYRPMRTGELPAYAKLAAESFMDYEFFTNYFPAEKKRRAFLTRLLTCEMKSNLGRMQAIVALKDDKPAAIALLCPPEYERPSDGAYIRNGFFGACLAGGLKDALQWNDMNTKNDVPCHAVENAWYLSLLTIAEDMRGQGIGTAFMKECILPYIREHGGKTVTLVTNSVANCRFYERLGFRAFHAQSFDYKDRVTNAWSYSLSV